MGVQITEENYDPKKTLPNEMWERFVLARFRNKSMAQSWIDAQVYEEGEQEKTISRGVAHTQGYRLLQNVVIKKRIEYLKKQRMRKYKDLDKALEREYKKAVSDQSYSPHEHLTALRDASKFIGKGTDQHNHVYQGSITIKNNFGVRK